MKTALALVLVLFGLVSSGSALAWRHGPNVRFGVVVGGPLWWGPGYYPPSYYYPPYYYPPAYYPPAYYPVPAAPTVYIEQGAAQPAPAVQQAPAAQPQASYWYYCNESKTYYPYVKECAGGWQRVSPQPPPG